MSEANLDHLTPAKLTQIRELTTDPQNHKTSQHFFVLNHYVLGVSLGSQTDWQNIKAIVLYTIGDGKPVKEFIS